MLYKYLLRAAIFLIFLNLSCASIVAQEKLKGDSAGTSRFVENDDDEREHGYTYHVSAAIGLSSKTVATSDESAKKASKGRESHIPST